MVTGRRRQAGPYSARIRHARLAAMALWVVAAAARTLAQDVAAPDSLGADEVPGDLQEVIAELEQADQPLPWRDLGDPSVPTSVAIPAADGFRASWRGGAAAGTGRQDARLELTAGAWRGTGVLRLRPDRTPEAAGAGSVRVGGLGLWLGHLALRHGFGLTGQAPGRRGALAADQGLGGITGGLAARTAAGSAADGLQAAAEIARGAWRLAGAGDLPGKIGDGRRWAARLERDGGRSRWALAAGTGAAGAFVSGAGRLERSPLVVSWEAARLAPADGPRELALVTAASWRATGRLRLELMAGLADGPAHAATAVLPGGARQGWAARLAWRDRATGALEILAQGSSGPLAQAAPARRRAGVLEAAWERRTARVLTVHVRCRRTAREDLDWSPREPWLPAARGEPLLKTSLSAGLQYEDGGRRAAAQWRSFTAAGGATRGNRQLLALSASRRWSGGWEAWCDVATAWGDDVDLARAVVPLPGLVTARHWGSWRAETVVGGGRRWGAFEVHLAVAQRLPDAETPATRRAVREAWLQARAGW